MINLFWEIKTIILLIQLLGNMEQIQWGTCFKADVEKQVKGLYGLYILWSKTI